MPMQSFVNPLPKLSVKHWLQFDFPADYCAKDTMPNINIEPPGIEAMYGKLGTPPKEQAHPFMREYPAEMEDPDIVPNQDQIVDLDRQIQICHTGRLSGNFVKYIAASQYHSVVEIFAVPVGPAAGTPRPISKEDHELAPQSDGPNVWYWKDPNSRSELLYTAQTIVDPKKAGLIAEQIYKLVCKWSFWDLSGNSKERMPISGFDEAVSFEVSQRTQDF